MTPADVTPQLERLLDVAVRLFESTEAEAILLLVEEPLDWPRLRQLASSGPVLVAADDEAHLAGAEEHGLKKVVLDVAGAPTFADADAVVLWTAGVSMDVRVDTGGIKSLIRGGSGELLQMAFGGQGFVMVQPSESVIIGGAQATQSSGGGGVLGGLLGG